MYRAILLAVALTAVAWVKADPVFITEAGAIRGYDPVAYFLEGKPVQGRADIIYTWQDAEWHFVNRENRDRFAADPDKYAPQYGGYISKADENWVSLRDEPYEPE